MDDATTQRPDKRRRWVFRLILLVAPFALLSLVEVGLRVGGVGEDLIWDSPYVRFAEGHRFFPQWDDQVEMPKPADVYRIVALGGSSTMGGNVERAFPELVGKRLRAALPDRRFEVINGGYLAMGSHRVYEVQREAARFDPDLYLIYLGHNEFLEDVAVDPVKLVSEQRGLTLFLRRLRMVTVLGRWLGTRATGTEDVLDLKFQQPDFPLIRSEEQVETRHAFLAYNVGRMIDLARAHGAEVMVVPAVANPLIPPGNPEHGPGVGDDARRWDLQLEKAWNAHCEGRHQEAVDVIEGLHRTDDQFARSHYVLGVCLLALDRPDAARDALRRSNALDRNGARSSPAIFDVIFTTCRDRGVPAIDLRGLFDREAKAEFNLLYISGRQRLFLDHCHPSQIGHEMIADALAERIVEDLARE